MAKIMAKMKKGRKKGGGKEERNYKLKKENYTFLLFPFFFFPVFFSFFLLSFFLSFFLFYFFLFIFVFCRILFIFFVGKNREFCEPLPRRSWTALTLSSTFAPICLVLNCICTV